mmetsp:Transcript_21675/g.61712  ORF Transcript_21675/g.61712 Transcript_21675/m.61712 type:complete len:120 (+) Transcript_21675:369-728(+)
MEPSAVQVFSFHKNQEIDEKFLGSPRVVLHATHYMQMIDRAIDLLGPDIETLTVILAELGERHSRFGVRPSMYGPMRTALIETLEEILGDKFTDECKLSWAQMYDAIAYDMMWSGLKSL